ncbi:T9SS type A sorting domain-containing protein [Hymenobacter sp. J193]|uniref:T9SS type A sorting domain-containing protein n=1 Tax=Hymenobacter sp. J193 TaxID=2898429 RepID=UPI002150A80A|nr:T9SS type A sorting domain-containing protein [Hymenobacter sp. J193]MCR5888541.1 T9SS type A sorting domain-containing protein [Hymenobacter sp. J193]
MPTARFDAFPISRPQNLTRLLGSRVTLISPQDTLALEITFDPHTGLNTLRQGATDTMLTADVFRFRGLYYFVESLGDSSCWVHAVRIERGQVQGLNTGYWQMDSLTSLVKQNAWPELVRYHSAARDSFRLRFDRRVLRKFYAGQPGIFPIYRVQPQSTAQRALVTQPHTTAPDTSISLYPNPASRQATLDFGTAADREVQVYTTQGGLIKTYSVKASLFVLPVAELPAATYLVRITSMNSSKPGRTLRLLVQH